MLVECVVCVTRYYTLKRTDAPCVPECFCEQEPNLHFFSSGDAKCNFMSNIDRFLLANLKEKKKKAFFAVFYSVSNNIPEHRNNLLEEFSIYQSTLCT